MLLICYCKRIYRAVIYYRITEGALVKRTNFRVIRPDMCLGVNKNRVPRADVVLELPEEIFHAPELIRYRKGAQHLHDILRSVERYIVRVRQYNSLPRKAYACRNVAVPRDLGMISIEKCRPPPAITAIPQSAQLIFPLYPHAEPELHVYKGNRSHYYVIQHPRSHLPQPSVAVAVIFIDSYRVPLYAGKLILQLVVIVIYFSVLHEGYYLHKKLNLFYMPDDIYDLQNT